MMDKERSHMAEKILNLTMEIIYLLTGEDYTVVKKTSQENLNLKSDLIDISKKEKINNQKILEVTCKIIQLVTGGDSEQAEKATDMCKKIKTENNPLPTSPDASSNRNPSERRTSPPYSQDCEQEAVTIPHEYQAEDLLGIKVEIVDGEEYTREHGPYSEEPCPTFITPQELGGFPESNRDPIMRGFCTGEDLQKDVNYSESAPGNRSILLSHLKIEEVEDPMQPSLGDNAIIPNLHLGLDNTEWLPDCIRKQKRPNNKIYPCSECDKCFTHISNRIRHMKIHKGLKPFACSECGKCFARKSHVSEHQRIHTGEKPFSCLLCGKFFKHKSHLVIHNRTHTGEKPFLCLHCGKCFAQKANLLYHQRVHAGGTT